MSRLNILLVLLINLLSCGLAAQSLPGPVGLLNAPSAVMLKDGTFYMGANYLNRNYIGNYGDGKYNCLIYYFDLTFLPFLEVNFRNTRVLDYHGNSATVDRMFSGKIRVLKERKYWPAIVLGVNDVLTTARGHGNQWFGATYIAMTKYFNLKNNTFGGTIGYAYPLSRNNQFSGVFGGISFSPFFLRQFTFMAEFDSRYFNVGGSVLFFKHLYVFCVLQGMESLSGGIAYRISVFAGFKRKNDQQGLP